MTKIQNFHEELERDFQRLTAEIKDYQAKSEFEKKPEKELVKESLKKVFSKDEEAESEKLEVKPAEKEKESVSKKKAIEDVLPSYLKEGKVPSEVELAVENLISIVFKEGLSKAMKEAKKQPPFIADAFHDALVDKLLPILKERGII